MKDFIYLNKKYFRPGTKHQKYNLNFFLVGGGLGDYINHMAAFEWIANECPHVVGRIFTASPFDEVAMHIMKPYPQWSIHKRGLANKIMKSGDYNLDPHEFSKHINATGAHLLDLGFMLYANRQKAMDGYNRLPSIKYDGKTPLDGVGFDENGYAVFTPGHTVDARQMPPDAFNELVNYTISKGITPVYLGKSDFMGNGMKDPKGYYGKFNPEYKYPGIDLREKTTLLQAIKIMGGAKFTLGIDNGLLHFAGCTEAPIIFGHNVASVEDREIRRPKGETINISLSKESLPCIGCQSNMRFIMGHKFSNCIYGDTLCLKLLFHNNSEVWKRAIDKVLNGTTN